MKTLIVRSFVLLAALLCLRAHAEPSLFLHPTVQTAQSQSLVLLDLMIADLKDEDPAAVIGGFDVTLSFDPAYLALESVDFDIFLGTPGADTFDLVELDNPTPAAATVRLFSLSLLEVSGDACIFCTGPFLADLQGDSFRLARLAFSWHGAAPATTTVSFASAALAGGFGENLAIAALVPAQVEIPEPATTALFGLGLVVLGMTYRGRRQLVRAQGARP